MKKLSFKEHLMNIVKESNDAHYEAIRPKLEQYESVFLDGLSKVKANSDGTISYYGEIEFSDKSYVDESGKLPFKFGYVERLVLSKGYCDKLKTLDGLPTSCRDLNITVEGPRPSKFFEGHFPKKLHSLDLTVSSLDNCKFGIETVSRLEFSLSGNYPYSGSIKSFEGLPREIDSITFNHSPEFIETFEGFPDGLGTLRFYGSGAFGVKDLAKHVKRLNSIVCTQTDLEPKTPMLSLFKIKGLDSLSNDNMILDECKLVFKIMNKYLRHEDIFTCQEEMIDNGFSQYARTK